MTMRQKNIFLAAVATAMVLLPGSLRAQQQPSVADAARKAQAEKKDSSKAVRVFTNDDIESVKGTISVVGAEPAPPPDQAAAAADKSKAAAQPKAAPAKDEAYWRKEFADARKKLADDAHELDILQREYNLKQQQYYSDPNTAMKEQYNRSDLTDTKKQIDDKTQLVAQDKQAIEDLRDQLRQAGGDPGWATEAK
jgi:chromosome segregation ATPase